MRSGNGVCMGDDSRVCFVDLTPHHTGRCTTWTVYQKLARRMSVVIRVLVASDSFQLKVSEELLRKVCRRNKGLRK